MKVKELKPLLDGVDENADVLISDVAEKCLQIVGGGELCCGNLILDVRQEFPEEYYKDGEEIRWIKGKAVIPKILDEEVFDLSLTHSGIFEDNGDEHILTFEFHDGYALCRDDESIEMVYPKLCELTDERIEEIDDYIGGRASDSGYITPGDVCLILGAVRIREPKSKEWPSVGALIANIDSTFAKDDIQSADRKVLENLILHIYDSLNHINGTYPDWWDRKN